MLSLKSKSIYMESKKKPNQVAINIQPKEPILLKPKELRTHIDDDLDDVVWDSCCLRCDKDIVVYLGKMFVAISVLVFSFLMLQNTANDAAYYTSTISLLLGHFLGEQSGQNAKKKAANQN